MSVAWGRRVILAAVFAMGTACPSLAEPGKRIALVIGNSAYQHTSRLANPANDADDIAATLSGLGFEVTKRQDLKKHEMDSTLGAFAGSLKGAEIGLFFYAGHGLQVAGQNYLVPVDAKLESALGAGFRGRAARCHSADHGKRDADKRARSGCLPRQSADAQSRSVHGNAVECDRQGARAAGIRRGHDHQLFDAAGQCRAGRDRQAQFTVRRGAGQAFAERGQGACRPSSSMCATMS